MKQETLDLILDAWDEACARAGFENFSSFLAAARQEMAKQLKMLKHARTRETFKALLAREAEPTPEELKAHIETARTFLYTFRRLLPRAVKEATKRIPHPAGGRPKKLKDEDYPKVCKQIGKLLGEGVELPDAQQRVALKFGVGVRTIRRAWATRFDIARRKDKP